MFAITAELRWEQLLLAAAVIGAVIYIGRGLRRAAKALDRWDSIPEMAANVERITREVVPPGIDDDAVPHVPLHARVAVLELAVNAIRKEMATADELNAHTGQDAENFDTIHGQLNELIERPATEPATGTSPP